MEKEIRMFQNGFSSSGVLFSSNYVMFRQEATVFTQRHTWNIIIYGYCENRI